MKSTTRLLIRTLGVLTAMLACGLGFVYWYDSSGQRADDAFDTTVRKPAYSVDHPRVAFDVAHNNWHTPTGRYRPLAKLLSHDGYAIEENTVPFSDSSLSAVQVLVVANALGKEPHEGSSPFSDAEQASLVRWVRAGGAVLLVADHVPFGAAAQDLAAHFGVRLFLAFARDDRNSGWDNERLVFSRTNGLLGNHPILEGADAGERVNRVMTFTGQSLSVPRGATALLRMGPDSYDWESRTKRTSAAGHAQAIALPFDKGRVVVLGEAGVLSAQVDPLGFKMGMNKPGSDDRQFALNIFHWLSGLY